MADWQSALQSLLDNSDLPAGNENAHDNEPAETSSQQSKLPVLTIFFERKGRGGKEATIIAGFEDTDDKRVAEVARTIKQRLGTGGSARGGEILIQGDRRGQVAALLREMGYKVKGV